MTRRNILWLCSWYPNRLEPFNGDFIQRHARAAALYHDIHVLHLAPDPALKKVVTDINSMPGLTEEIIYFPKRKTLIGKIAAYFRWKRLYRRAIDQYIRQYGPPVLVHVQVPVRAGLMAIWLKRKWGLPYVVTEHWGIYNDIIGEGYTQKPAWLKNMTRKIIKNASAFVSVSHYLAAGVQKLVIDRNYRVIRNTVDTSLFFYKERTTASFRFIHVSGMIPLKNPEGILRAFRELVKEEKDVELWMVGDTTGGIREYAHTLGFPDGRVFFTGEVSYAEVAKQMQASHCLLLNSLIENSPCVIGEAHCCGLPVIATATGGIPELVNEANGLLVPVQDDASLLAAMRRMIRDYGGIDRAAIEAAAHKDYSYDAIGRQHQELYREILGE